MTGNSRLFTIIVLFLVGIVVLGLLATGGVVLFGSINRAQQAARPTATATLAIVWAPTPTRTSTPTPTPLPTSTPLPTPTHTPRSGVQPTPTPVSGAQHAGEMSAQADEPTTTPTATPVPAATLTKTAVPGATPAAQSTTPDTGMGGLEAVLIAAGLVSVLVITRRLRTNG